MVGLRKISSSPTTITEGFRSGSLVVVDGEPKRRVVWKGKTLLYVLCFCEVCGNPKQVRAHLVRTKQVKTCGCSQNKTPSTEGMNNSLEALQYLGHRQRQEKVSGSPKVRYWKVRCKRCGHVSEKPETYLKKGSSCKNCFRRHDYKGELLTVAEIAARVGVHKESILKRLRNGENIEQAARPKGRLYSVDGKLTSAKELAAELKLPVGTIGGRLSAGIRTRKELVPSYRRNQKLRVGEKIGHVVVLKVTAEYNAHGHALHLVRCERCGAEVLMGRQQVQKGSCAKCSRRLSMCPTVTIAGKQLPLIEACELFEVTPSMFAFRTKKKGMPIEEALTTPRQRKKKRRKA